MVKSSIQKPFRRKRTTRPLKKSNMVPTKALTNAVKQITMKEKEVKCCQATLLTNKSINGGGLSFSGLIFNNGAGVPNVLAGLALGQGTQNNQRLGNEVSVKSLTLKGIVQQSPYNALTNTNRTPFDVYMIVYKRKQNSDGNPATIKEYDSNNMGPIDGSIARTVLDPFNRNGYIIKKVRKFKMQPASEIITGGSSSTPGLAILNPQIGSGTRDFFTTFSVKVPIKKILQFNDADTEPKNDWCTVGFYYINGNASATAGGTLTESRANITLQAQLRYTDD